MKIKTVCVVVTTVLVSATVAIGAVKEGSFCFSPMVGGYIFGDNQQFNSSVALGVRGGYSLTKEIGIEALYDYVTPTDSRYWGIKNITMHRFGAQGLYHFIPDNQLVPYLAAGVSGVTFDGSGVNNNLHVAFDYGAGAKYFVSDDIAIRADVRHLLYGYNNTSYNNVEIMLGASFQFGGVPLKVKAAAAEVPTASSAPAPVVPVTPPAPEAEPAKCPQVPPVEVVKSVIVPVTREACEPFIAAAAKEASSGSGSDSQAVCTGPPELTMLFTYEKTEIKPKYYEEIDNIGNFLKSFSNAKVVIEGHSSAMGDKDADLKLSQARADTVKSHLMYKFGIDSGRIIAKGYGVTRPVASNKTTGGRMQNRRVVAVVSCE